MAPPPTPSERPDPADFAGWSRALFGHYFKFGPSAMHGWLADRLQDAARRRNARLAALAPRGEAKSTWASLLNVLWCALNGIEPYIWVCSDTVSQTRKHLRNVAEECQTNDLLRAAYPAELGAGCSYNSDQIRLANGCLIEGLSTGQNVRGRRRRAERPTLIVLDDPEGEDSAYSPLTRERVLAWFDDALLKAGQPGTNVVVLGTAIHEECLALKLLGRAGWEARKWQAVVSWPDRMDLWAQWEAVYTDKRGDDSEVAARAFYEANREAMDAGAEVLWPDRWPLYSLMCERAQSGHRSFERERQNNPLNPDACEWPERYFGPACWFDDFPPPSERSAVVVFLDPSKGAEAKHGDFAAFVVLVRDRKGRLWCQAELVREPAEALVERAAELCRVWKPDGFGIESNAFQYLLGDSLRAKLRKACLSTKVYLVNNYVRKPVRIRRLGDDLAGGLIRFRAGHGGTRLLVDQLRQFPLAEHDDGPDALESGKRVMAEVLGEKR